MSGITEVQPNIMIESMNVCRRGGFASCRKWSLGPRSDPRSTNIARFAHRTDGSGRIWPNFDNTCSVWAMLWSSWANSWSSSANVGPDLAQIDQQTKLGRSLVNSYQSIAQVDQICRIWATTGPSRPKPDPKRLVEVRPILGLQCHLATSFGHLFGNCWATAKRFGTAGGNFLACAVSNLSIVVG